MQAQHHHSPWFLAPVCTITCSCQEKAADLRTSSCMGRNRVPLGVRSAALCASFSPAPCKGASGTCLCLCRRSDGCVCLSRYNRSISALLFCTTDAQIVSHTTACHVLYNIHYKGYWCILGMVKLRKYGHKWCEAAGTE